jgi:hypothetical protein
MDRLGLWLKESGALGGAFDEEAEGLAAGWLEAQAELEEAVQAAVSCQVAEDEYGFLEAVGPVKAALARAKENFTLWEAFLAKIEPQA